MQVGRIEQRRQAMHRLTPLGAIGIAWSGLVFGSLAFAQDSTRGYGPIAAGDDAYRYHEAQRLNNINRQLGVINQMKWYSGLPAINGALGSTAWYGGAGGGYVADPPSLD